MVLYIHQNARSGLGAFFDKELSTQYGHKIKS